MRPSRTHSSQSSGIVAAVVFPYLWMLWTHLLLGNAQGLRAVLVDAEVGLVHQHEREVAIGGPLRFRISCRDLDHLRGRHLEDVAAVHDRDVVAPAELLGVGVGPMLEAGAGDVELLVVGSGSVEDLVDDPALAFRRLHYHRGSGVAEEHDEVPEAASSRRTPRESAGVSDFPIM